MVFHFLFASYPQPFFPLFSVYEALFALSFLTSETEEQRKERLRIRREKDRARRRTKGKKSSPDTDDYEKQRLVTLKRLKRGEVDLRLEKVVASKQLRLAVETEEERRTRLEAFLKSWQLCLLPARASEQGNVIGLVSVYIYTSKEKSI